MEDSDLVFYQENGHTKSVGYKINNEYLNKIPALVQKGGGKDKSFAIPAGLYLMHEKLNQHSKTNFQTEDSQEAGVIGDDLYNRLLELSAPRKGGNKRKNNNTRKKRNKKNRTTRKKK